jgi:hypothetical protein
MRSIRDYKISIDPDSESLGSPCPFNIIAEALTLPNFTQAEIKALYGQHTEATGQVFDDAAVQRAWFWTEGQPWLVNALAKEAVERILSKDYKTPITEALIDQAADNLTRRRDAHIESLLASVLEPCAQRIIEPMLATTIIAPIADPAIGTAVNEDVRAKTCMSHHDDLQYCLDLGLIQLGLNLRPANQIYASVIVRHLGELIRQDLPDALIGQWTDGQNLDLTGLLKAFQKFWATGSDKYIPGLRYREAAPHILLAAFVQRALDGDGLVTYEFASGFGYAVILITYAGKKYVMEVKLNENELSRESGKAEILGHMDRYSVKEGWLVIFDRKSTKSWSKRLAWSTEEVETGQTIHVAGC